MSFIVPLQRPPGLSTQYAIADQLTRIGEPTQGGILGPLVKAGLYDNSEMRRSEGSGIYGQTKYILPGQPAPQYDPINGIFKAPQQYAINSVVYGRSRADVGEDTPAILFPHTSPQPISDDAYNYPHDQEYDLRHSPPSTKFDDHGHRRNQVHPSKWGGMRGVAEPQHRGLPGYSFPWRAGGKNHLGNWSGWDDGHDIREEFYGSGSVPAILVFGGLGLVALTMAQRG